MSEVQVISGSQGPEQRFAREPVEPDSFGSINLRTLSPSVVVFQSRYSAHQLTLTRPRRIPDTDPPQFERGLGLHFEGGIALVETDPVVRPDGAKTVELAKRHRAFNVDFWDAREAQSKADQAQETQKAQQLEDAITNDPALIKRVLAAIEAKKLAVKEQAGDKFDLPPKKAEEPKAADQASELEEPVVPVVEKEPSKAPKASKK